MPNQHTKLTSELTCGSGNSSSSKDDEVLAPFDVVRNGFSLLFNHLGRLETLYGRDFGSGVGHPDTDA